MTLGGGHGRLQGKHGLYIDALASIRMVLADGTALTVSATQHPDLFYGMKGAGQNLGVVVEMVFNTYEQTPGGEYYTIDMVYNEDKVEDVLSPVNTFIPNQPPELALVILLVPDSPSVGRPSTYGDIHLQF